MTIEFHGLTETTDVESLDESWATMHLQGGGRFQAARDERLVQIAIPNTTGIDEVIHPGLAKIASVFSWWDGRESFHAAGVVVDRAAWAIAGDKEGGKSSLAAYLHGQGFPILTDDMVAVDGLVSFPGPRCLDLRPGTSARLGITAVPELSRSRQRERIRLPQIAPSFPLAGWVFLEWGGELSTERVPPGARLRRLAATRMWAVPPADPSNLLGLSALPFWVLTRPRRWDGMADVVERLLGICTPVGR